VTALSSPYSTPSHAKRPVGRSETSGSGYDSGIESGSVRVRGKGAGSSGQMTGVREHCKSSGYESFGLDCESLSLGSGDSAQGALLPILSYTEQTVRRMDRTWRFQEVKRLKKRQEELKTELSSAKARIGSEPGHWSYELHTEESGMEPTDPNFVEAFERETAILDKRVQACRSHVSLSTAFVGRRGEEERGAYQGCTSDCDWEERG
jgi:kinesin family protein 26